ncbi:GreA/GreB family elongation factor [Kordia algicida OT-1]|uniref:Transcription elongation factor n=1 Tax=Kordia algicida OT-1 TaxID=391587 RepID=A9EDE5_9FLAO|nr:GreA/GreB family elongation factor [Kordia algicida]EDP94221.1 transcription elongation factor [Kordia algicida OT-1]
MKYGSLILEKKEYVYLKRILNISGYTGDFEVQNSLLQLNKELKNALIVDESEMPNDIIRFNSIVSISAENNWKKTLQIVIPTEVDIEKNKISILTPLGASLIGRSSNDNIQCTSNSGEQKIIIESVRLDKNQEKIKVLI